MKPTVKPTMFRFGLAGCLGLLAAVAVVLAVPLAWFVNNLWMQQFAFRVGLGPSVFVLGVGALLVLALATIGSQATRAALANPVDTLRYE